MSRIGCPTVVGKPRAIATLVFVASTIWLSNLAESQTLQSSEPATSETVLLGMSAALRGPTSSLGVGMREGVEAAIREANQRAAATGRTLKLVALDDGYEPSRTGPAMRQLIEREHVAAVIGNVGTPTAVAAIPIVNETHIPLVGCFTGAGNLRKTPPDRYVINYRASYAELHFSRKR
jgi:branched-chain amino acid transport system substrate-binding protein